MIDHTKAKNCSLREFIVHKYSNRGEIPLHEAAIIEGVPFFLTYERGTIKSVKQIHEPNRILRPPDPEDYPYDPYKFSNMEEVITYLDRAKRETPGSLYQKGKLFVSAYNDQDEEVTILITSVVVWSYFQDKFGTTHYDEIVGDNGSGKSTIGHTFESIGYRPVNMTDPSAANLFRVLGSIEPGQCTIIADEADNIDKSHQMMSILKNGYQIRGRVFKVNMNSQQQEFFYAYCYKMIICERSLKQGLAKGVLDRTFTAKTFKGKPRFDIKETLNPVGDKKRVEQFAELIDFRKLMLVYRLIHFQDPIADVELQLDGRDRELCKPILQLFHDTNVEKEVEMALRKFLSDKNRKKQNTIEYALYPIVVNLVSNYGKAIYVKQLWSEIILNIRGICDEAKKPNEYITFDYDVIYRNTISKIICDKFGAQIEHRKDGNVLLFDLDKLARASRAYNFEVSFQSKLQPDKSEGNIVEGSEGSEGDIEKYRKNNSAESKRNSTKISDRDVDPNIYNSNRQNRTKIHNYNESKMNNTEYNTPLSSLLLSQPSSPSLSSPKPNIYRIGRTDTFGCENCNNKGDRWFMQEHVCT